MVENMFIRISPVNYVTGFFCFDACYIIEYVARILLKSINRKARRWFFWEPDDFSKTLILP